MLDGKSAQGGFEPFFSLGRNRIGQPQVRGSGGGSGILIMSDRATAMLRRRLLLLSIEHQPEGEVAMRSHALGMLRRRC
jgi:hypothetical protein